MVIFVFGYLSEDLISIECNACVYFVLVLGDYNTWDNIKESESECNDSARHNVPSITFW